MSEPDLKSIAAGVHALQNDQMRRNIEDDAYHESLVKALREVLTDNNSQDRPILINRIPFICNDIVAIKKDVAKINDNLSRVVWIVLTAVILAVLGMIFTNVK